MFVSFCVRKSRVLGKVLKRMPGCYLEVLSLLFEILANSIWKKKTGTEIKMLIHFLKSRIDSREKEKPDIICIIFLVMIGRCCWLLRAVSYGSVDGEGC